MTGTVPETAPKTASNTPPESEQFMYLVARLITAQPDLTSIQAGIIIAAEQNIARDSRTFARLLGLAHALVLREITTLCDQNRLTITKQDARTLRTFYEMAGSLD
ncbi:hypothetical protein [Thalassospira sp. GB04J01]|uniref:hypothetical protein n=1 Tax=Thalassospira sp. GB04J01 TaxID=1485225 RepID=UPI0018E0B665|nr:hypothetical protein [Thalassospira sp. GB04J01]